MRKCIPCGTPAIPYYKDEKNNLTQDHASIFRDTQYAAGIEFPEEFTVPAIGEDIQVCVKNLVNLVVGSYIWNPSYGYLQIAHWDSCTGKIGLLNDDISGAAIPGTVVSAGSLFAVTARPCCADQDNFSLFPFLAEDYVIPGVGNSVTLSVTSTFGLIEGTFVRIGSNVYFLDQINSSLEIQVTNQGAGGAPGATVAARDVNGDLQYLITQAVASACISPGNDTIKLIGCVGTSEAILEGDYAGQVPVLQDSATEEVMFQLLDTEVRTCTSLLTPVNITPGVGTYTFEVEDASLFTAGQILEVQSSSLRFEITSITVNDIDVTSIPNPAGVTTTLQAGEWVCLILTTELLQDEIDVIVTGSNDHCKLMEAYAGSITGTQAAVAMYTWSGLTAIAFAAMPYDGIATAISINLPAARSAGDFAVLLYKNNVYTASFLLLNAGQVLTGVISPIPFLAGDYLDLRFNSNAFAMGGALPGSAVLWGIIK